MFRRDDLGSSSAEELQVSLRMILEMRVTGPFDWFQEEQSRYPTIVSLVQGMGTSVGFCVRGSAIIIVCCKHISPCHKLPVHYPSTERPRVCWLRIFSQKQWSRKQYGKKGLDSLFEA